MTAMKVIGWESKKICLKAIWKGFWARKQLSSVAE